VNVSYRWLNEYIDLTGVSPEDLAERLTRGGIEVGSITTRNEGVSGVKVGLVKTRDKHPNADKLSVCTVDVGQGTDLQIVCGASNVAAGQKVPVALAGASLPGGVTIREAEVRGVKSQGMICSARELGLNVKLFPKELQEGILVLPEDAEVGTDVAQLLELDDKVLELELTPNRADCLSMLGVAYEAAALTGRSVQPPEAGLSDEEDEIAGKVTVTVLDRDLCPHYAARHIRGVRIGPSPLWLQNRLMAAGIRPINNVVDVTNFVMLEYGQPLHAFDAAKVAQGRIVVRRAKPGERMVTLDGQERELTADTLVIADAERAIAIAGVMGGANSEVTDDTADIILESARFDAAGVRVASRRLGLRTEASLRFEKGADPARVRAALDRAADLIARLAGGRVTEGVAEVLADMPEPRVVELSLERINRVLGTSLEALEVGTIWSRLGFGHEPLPGPSWRVRVPTRRLDIALDVDLIEEVARLHGYDKIPATPIEGPATTGTLTKAQAIRREIRRVMNGAGLHEAVSYALTSAERAALFPDLAPGVRPIQVAMPMSEERTTLRTSLIPSLMEAAANNRARHTRDIALFEMGHVFHTEEETLTRLPEEKQRLALLLSGQRRSAEWYGPAEPFDFYDAKGLLETLFARLGLADKIAYRAASAAGFHPGRTAAIELRTEQGPAVIGYVGQLHPDLQREWDFADTFVAEVELAPLYDMADASIAYRPLPRFPAVERDLAVVADTGVTAAELTAAATAAAGEWLESVRVFDVYNGERLGAGKKSVALSLVFRHPERTLTDEEANEAQACVLAALEQTFGAKLRE
jgi:phenylalanyl-tRNA synthetase beta chain